MSGTGFAGRTEGAGKDREGERRQGGGVGMLLAFRLPIGSPASPIVIPAGLPPVIPAGCPLSFLLAALCHSRWLPSVIPAVFSGNPVEGARTPGPPHPCPLPPGEREEEGRGERKGEGTPAGCPCHSRWLPSVIPAVFSGNPAEGHRTPGPPHPCPLPPGERGEEGRGEGKGSAGRGEATDRLFL